jgi:CheY-like chemotaxis protein
MLDSGGMECCPRNDVDSAARRVLVIENDRELRECMQHVLEDEGFPTIAADHGHSALEALRTEGQLPDVIVLDLMMPIMNGWDFLESIRSDPKLVSIPVIVITGAPERLDRERVSRALRKPVDLDQLLEAVRNAG